MSIFRETDLKEYEDELDVTETQDIQNLSDEDYYSKAKRHMIQFFENKTTCEGNPISMDRLLTTDNIEMVASASIEEAMEIIYSAISCDDIDDDDSGLIGDDVKIVLSALKRCSEARVPQEFVGGMTLLYLELCKGLNFE